MEEEKQYVSLPWFGALVTVVTVWGIVHLCRTRRDPAVYLAIALVVLMLVWPFRYTRFCLPFLPLCVAGFLLALTRLPGRLRWGRWLFVGLMLVGFLARDVHMLYAPPRERFVDLRVVVDFLEEHTEPEAVIGTHGPEGRERQQNDNDTVTQSHGESIVGRHIS